VFAVAQTQVAVRLSLPLEPTRSPQVTKPSPDQTFSDVADTKALLETTQTFRRADRFAPHRWYQINAVVSTMLLSSTTAFAQPMPPMPMQPMNTPAMAGTVSAQGRQQVKMETKAFLSTHTLDANTDIWSLKSGVEPPTGVLSRATVKAQGDEFMRNNRWDNTKSGYVPIAPAPREPSTLTHAEMRTETAQFMFFFHGAETTERWIETSAARPSK